MYLTEAVIKPWSSQVELTMGCNLRCPFCYINIMPWKRDYRDYMKPDNALRIATELITLNDKIRIEFAMRGEPMLNPDVVECVEAFRKGAPESQLQMTSNGTVLMELSNKGPDFVFDLFDAGLNILMLDCYIPYGNKLKDIVNKWRLEDVEYHTYGHDKFSPWNNHGPVGNHIIFMEDIRGLDFKITRKITNMGGNSSWGRKLDEPLETMCPIPWREVPVFATGEIPLCCNDAGVEYLLGNILDEPLVDIWTGEKAQSARKMLRYGQRWFNPCSRCDGPTPGRNRAIPHCDKATEHDYNIVYRTIHESPRHNGAKVEWWKEE